MLLRKIQYWLDGKKTYIGIIVGAVYSVLIATGVTENDQMIWTAIGTWTGISFRLGVTKSGM